MKHSVRGSMRTADSSLIMADINQFPLWGTPVTADTTDGEGYQVFVFEVWVNSLADKDQLFNLLKLHVDEHTGAIDWHNCTHDEIEHQPCVIVETYQRG